MNSTSFRQCWNQICANLRPIPKMYSWSVAGRAKSSFCIFEVARDGITVKTAQDTRRFVPRRDFESIYDRWTDYKNGKIKRHELRDLSVHSTYVVSVLHWLELQ